MNWPTTPPAVSRSVPVLQCRVASPQLANNIEREATDAHRGIGARAPLFLLAMTEHHEAGHAEHQRE